MMENQITESNKRFLYNRTSALALNDFRMANRKPRYSAQGYALTRPYSLSFETEEARQMYSLALKPAHSEKEVIQVIQYIRRLRMRGISY